MENHHVNGNIFKGKNTIGSTVPSSAHRLAVFDLPHFARMQQGYARVRSERIKLIRKAPENLKNKPWDVEIAISALSWDMEIAISARSLLIVCFGV